MLRRDLANGSSLLGELLKDCWCGKARWLPFDGRLCSARRVVSAKRMSSSNVSHHPDQPARLVFRVPPDRSALTYRDAVTGKGELWCLLSRMVRDYSLEYHGRPDHRPCANGDLAACYGVKVNRERLTLPRNRGDGRGDITGSVQPIWFARESLRVEMCIVRQ